MTRAEAITIISDKLAALDDTQVQAVAEIVQSMHDSGLPRPLSERERQLLARSRDDFKAGRSYSLEDVTAYVDQALAPLGVPKSGA